MVHGRPTRKLWSFRSQHTNHKHVFLNRRKHDEARASGKCCYVSAIALGHILAVHNASRRNGRASSDRFSSTSSTAKHLKFESVMDAILADCFLTYLIWYVTQRRSCAGGLRLCHAGEIR